MNEIWPDTISGVDALSADPNLASNLHKKTGGDSASDAGSGVLDELMEGVVEVAGDVVGAVIGAAGDLLSGIFD